MNIVLGFGSTEVAEQEKILALVHGLIAENANLDRYELGLKIDAAIALWNERSTEYDAMPRGKAPQRYTKVWYYEDSLHFMHINRNHAFSEDGWAAWQVDIPLTKGGGE